MSNLNYPACGIYPQLTINSCPKPADKPAKKTSKVKDAAVLGAVCAAAGSIGFGIYKYRKGVGAINLKNKTFKEVSDFETFIKTKSGEEADHFKKIWTEGNKFENGLTGKIHKKLTGISNFFKKNFYNY